MDSGLYAACAGLVARTRALDTIAGNLANSSTGGFRAQRNTFGSMLAAAKGHTLAGLNHATNDYGILSGTRLDQTQGSLTQTGNDLDVAVEGPAFLKVQTRSGLVYTRNGSLQQSATGQLVTSAGDPVLGANGPITLPRGPVSISPDGTLSVRGAIAGKLALAEFAPGTEMANRGGSYYTAPARSEIAATQSGLRQGALEASNVSSVDSVVELISAQRSAESMRHILTMLDTEMDKTAATDLARVS